MKNTKLGLSPVSIPVVNVPRHHHRWNRCHPLRCLSRFLNPKSRFHLHGERRSKGVVEMRAGGGRQSCPDRMFKQV